MPWHRIFQDLRVALRRLKRNAISTSLAVLSLALAIGMNTAVFSFVDSLVLAQLRVYHPSELALVHQHSSFFHTDLCCFSWEFLLKLKRLPETFSDVIAVGVTDVNVRQDDRTERTPAELVSGNYFEMLGVRPALGRVLQPSDDSSEASAQICVISYDVWRRRFGLRSNIVGQRLYLNGEPFEIVGVAAEGFNGLSLAQPRGLFLPSAMVIRFLGDSRETSAWAHLVGRRKPGVGVAAAERAVDRAAREEAASLGQQLAPGDRFFLEDGSQGIEPIRHVFGQSLVLLTILAAIVLTMACGNLAALLSAEAIAGAREAGLRLALGARMRDVVRLSLTHAMALGATGGAIGWVLAKELVSLARIPAGYVGTGQALSIQADVRVLAFCIGVSLLSSVTFGMLPCLQLSGLNPVSMIQGASLWAASRKPMKYRVLIAAQVSLSLGLTFSAAVLIQTLRNLQSVSIGFRSDHLIMIPVAPSAGVVASGRAEGYFRGLVDRLRSTDGVRSVSLSTAGILTAGGGSIAIHPPTGSRTVEPVSAFLSVSSEYFSTLGIPLVAGRTFLPGEGDGSIRSVIVNEAFAARFLEGNALGQAFSYGGGRRAQIVGVVRDVKLHSLREEPQPAMYLSISRQTFPEELVVYAWTSADDRTATGWLAAAVHGYDAEIPVDTLVSIEARLAEALARERLLVLSSVILGIFASVLSGMGLYGVLAFSVARQAREVGIRVALGATRGDVLTYWLVEAARISIWGVALGIPFALLLGQLSAALLFGVGPRNTGALLGSISLSVLICAVACAAPGFRASRISPSTVLRSE